MWLEHYFSVEFFYQTLCFIYIMLVFSGKIGGVYQDDGPEASIKIAVGHIGQIVLLCTTACHKNVVLVIGDLDNITGRHTMRFFMCFVAGFLVRAFHQAKHHFVFLVYPILALYYPKTLLYCKISHMCLDHILDRKVIGIDRVYIHKKWHNECFCLLYTSPSPRDGLLSRM